MKTVSKISLKTIAAHWGNYAILGTLIYFGWNAKDFATSLIKEVASEQQRSLITADSIQTTSQLRTNLILKDLATKVDSSLIYSRKAYKISILNSQVNVEMSKQLKGFDILKFYDPFIFYNQKTEHIWQPDTVKKKLQLEMTASE